MEHKDEEWRLCLSWHKNQHKKKKENSVANCAGFFKEIKQNGSEPDGKIEEKKEKSFSVECCRILKPRNK